MKTFKIELRIDDANKIACIKAIKDTFGLGLKESKDFVEQSDYVQTVLMSEEQFKNLVFHNYMRKCGSEELFVFALSVEEYNSDFRDLRTLGTASC